MSDIREQYVVKIPRSDDKGSPVLLQVIPSGSASRPLDARLVGTESEAPYVLSCKSVHLAFLPVISGRAAAPLPRPTWRAAVQHCPLTYSILAWG